MKKFNAFKKVDNQYFVQWTKKGKFYVVEQAMAEFIIFCTVNK